MRSVNPATYLLYAENPGPALVGPLVGVILVLSTEMVMHLACNSILAVFSVASFTIPM
jgi:hypothetical protein